MKEQLDTARDKLLENSSLLLQLFRERAALARQIGSIKKELGLPPRIREREEEVMGKLEGMDPFSRSIMSALFEFSIMNEEARTPIATKFLEGGEGVKLNGTREHLEFLAGILFSRPGVEVYSERKLPEALAAGFQLKGAHIVGKGTEDPDLVICLDKAGESCDISLTEQGEIFLSPLLPFGDGPLKIKVS